MLQHLTSDVYEPLEEADFDHLTQETLFLLALATEARMSEVHALDIISTRFDCDKQASANLGLRFHCEEPVA